MKTYWDLTRCWSPCCWSRHLFTYHSTQGPRLLLDAVGGWHPGWQTGIHVSSVWHGRQRSFGQQRKCLQVFQQFVFFLFISPLIFSSFICAIKSDIIVSGHRRPDFFLTYSISTLIQCLSLWNSNEIFLDHGLNPLSLWLKLLCKLINFKHSPVSWDTFRWTIYKNKVAS